MQLGVIATSSSTIRVLNFAQNKAVSHAYTSSEPHMYVVQNKNIIFRQLRVSQNSEFALAGTAKMGFRLGIPRIELGTLRSLSVHLTTRLNPLLCPMHVCRFFRNERGRKFRWFTFYLLWGSVLQEVSSGHVFEIMEKFFCYIDLVKYNSEEDQCTCLSW